MLKPWKGEKIWLDTVKEQGTWIQCQQCGEIYFIQESVPIDKLYVASFCPRCNEYTKGLNCGDSIEDIYLFANINVDPRYYQY